jgi:hypothetical protein
MIGTSNLAVGACGSGRDSAPCGEGCEDPADDRCEAREDSGADWDVVIDPEGGGGGTGLDGFIAEKKERVLDGVGG